MATGAIRQFLVVEDDPNDAFLIGRAFARFPHCEAYICRKVSEAKSYMEGRGHYSDRKKYPFPSAVISDFHVGPDSGIDLFKWIRSNPAFANIPGILLTGSAPPRTVMSSSDWSANVTVHEKPGSLEALGNLIKKLCDETSEESD